MTGARRRLQRTLLVLLAVVATVAAVVALEGGVRLVGLVRTGSWPQTAEAAFRAELEQALVLYRRHPYLDVAPREGARVQAFGKQAAFNSHGYRSPERDLAKPTGTIRVLCAGGSTTFDLLAATDADTWPARLERELRAAGAAVEVWNAGFPGWTSLENLISLELRDVDLRPEVVVLLQGVNDLQPAGHRPFDPQYEHGHAEVTRRALGFEVAPLGWLDRSLVAERIRRWGRPVTDPWQQLRPAGPAGPRRPQVAAKGVATFARNVRSFVAVATAHGARVLLVTQTIHPRPQHAAADRAYLANWYPGLRPESAPRELERLNDVLRAVGREHADVTVVDAARGAWLDADFADPLHFSAQGSAKLADLLASELALAGGPRTAIAVQPR
jgi:lysophospholipase L1-like esterase